MQEELFERLPLNKRRASTKAEAQDDDGPVSAAAAAAAAYVGAGGDMPVNSRHHQAIDRVARGFTVAAAAPDGTIEAIEAAAGTESGFCIGVQWHPENFYRTGESAGLFNAFVAAANGSA